MGGHKLSIPTSWLAWSAFLDLVTSPTRLNWAEFKSGSPADPPGTPKWSQPWHLSLLVPRDQHLPHFSLQKDVPCKAPHVNPCSQHLPRLLPFDWSVCPGSRPMEAGIVRASMWHGLVSGGLVEGAVGPCWEPWHVIDCVGFGLESGVLQRRLRQEL